MSNLYQLYQQWNEQIKGIYKWKRPENHKVLAWLMVAIFVGKDVCLERLGINLPHEAKPESVGQQFRRWLKKESTQKWGLGDFDTDNKLRCCSEIAMTALIFEAYRAQIYHQSLFLRALL